MPSTIVLALDTVVFTIEVTPFDPDEMPVLSDVMRPEPAVAKRPLRLVITATVAVITTAVVAGMETRPVRNPVLSPFIRLLPATVNAVCLLVMVTNTVVIIVLNACVIIILFAITETLNEVIIEAVTLGPAVAKVFTKLSILTFPRVVSAVENAFTPLVSIPDKLRINEAKLRADIIEVIIIGKSNLDTFAE